MKTLDRFFVLLVICASQALICERGAPAQLYAQRNPKKEEAFVRAHPAVGDALPDVEVFTPDGQPFRTKDLRGHYAVLTFGCLT